MQTEPPKADPPKRKRRWFQFSLRTLLIGVTLLAVVCALAVPQYRRWERQRQEEAARERLRVLLDKMDFQVFDGGATPGNR